MHFSLASFSSTCLGILFNFKTIGRLVFKNDRYSLFFKFAGVYLFVYLVNIGFLVIFNIYEVNMYIAGAILIFPMAGLSFLINKIFVFKEKISEPSGEDGTSI